MDITKDVEMLMAENAQRYEREQAFLQARRDGRLFVNAPAGYLSERFDNPYRREDLARLWAYSPTDRQSRRRRLNWLQNERWETGVYWGYRVIIFFKYEDGDFAGMTLYRLDSLPFPGLKSEGTETLELDPEGNQILIIDPLPGALTYDKAAFWRGFDFMREHHGRTPKEVEAAKHRREQILKEYQAQRKQKHTIQGNQHNEKQ
ncbi:MAG: hypothetical protein IKX40_03420 [Thermoguttaceae bacterium]|nr:hypothetical protein [Thermoguttaceae bacterium]